MFTNQEYDTIKELAMETLEANVSVDVPTGKNTDLSTLPLSNFGDEQPMATDLAIKLQDCQAIIRRIDTQIYKKAGLEFKESEKEEKFTEEEKKRNNERL